MPLPEDTPAARHAASEATETVPAVPVRDGIPVPPGEAAEAAGAPVAVAAEQAAPDAAPRPRRKPSWFASGALSAAESLLMTVVIAVFVITFLVQAFQIPSESMENTLLIGDYLLVDKVHFAQGGAWGEVLPYTTIHRGDVVVFRYPVQPEQHFVKRVVGLPGDRIRLHHKQVYVNGRRLEERYVIYHSEEPDRWRDEFPRLDVINPNVDNRWWGQMHALVQDGELVVPAGRYFVLGDNRDESLDSRYWGLVPRENMIGRPLVIYWSLRHPRRIGQLAASDGAGDKLTYLACALRHFLAARWGRTLRVIN
jgi:signal peptidase I